MNRIIGVLFAALALTACGGSSTAPVVPVAKKLDPYIKIRVRDLLDTTSAPGRAHWQIYALLTGPNVKLNGISLEGGVSLFDIRLGHNEANFAAGADSIGQRLISVLAIADTTTSNLTPSATFEAIANAWYAGNHTLPAGWMALFNTPADAWNSAQFAAGHGLTQEDPIKWGLDWTGRGTVTFYETP